MGQAIENVSDLAEVFKNGLEAARESNFLDGLIQQSPWIVSGSIEGVGQSLPLVGFLAKQAANWLKDNPQQQGYAVCTLAYQQSVVEALAADQRLLVDDQKAGKSVARSLRQHQRLDEIKLDEFRLSIEALGHPFVQRADDLFRDHADAIQLDQPTTNRLLTNIHRSFLSHLRRLLTHPQTAERFRDFTSWMKMAPGDDGVLNKLALHNAYLQWLYYDAPVFGQERFALAHVYAETECGVLRWNQVRVKHAPGFGTPTEDGKTKPKNPFSEVDAPRQNLLDAVLDLFYDRDLNDPIVIQGVAGVGKSSFTVRLANKLIEDGFQPFWIRLGNVDVTRDLWESFPDALEYSGREFQQRDWDPQMSRDEFRSLLESQASCIVGEESQQHKLSPYVLILDGWDEIRTGASAGFRDDLKALLDSVRREFFGGHGKHPRIRVIITGRPTYDVSETKLLQDQTPLLTIRPFAPDKLEEAVWKFLAARKDKPLPAPTVTASEQQRPHGHNAESRDLDWFDNVFAEYRKRFNEMLEQHKLGNVDTHYSGPLAVMGLPLLAQLTVRLIVNLNSKEDTTRLIASPTVLYRALIDMTYEAGGKASANDLIPDVDRHRLSGSNLRILLWRVAAAISAMGNEEEISREELRLRLDWNSEDLRRIVAGTTDENVLSKLVIGFFFREGHRGGCAFLHKSFREYLLAEGVVELLKKYGKDPRVAAAFKENPANGLLERTIYWKGYDETDPRHDLVKDLSRVWATTWVTAEVQKHLVELLAWEIERSEIDSDKKEPRGWSGEPTARLAPDQWRWIRDGLADVWDWWADGVMLRCPPKIEKGKNTVFDPPPVIELTELCTKQDPEAWKPNLPDVVRITTVDARLGDAFCLLTAVVHAEIRERQRAKREPWKESVGRQERRYQSVSLGETGRPTIRFRISGENPQYFRCFVARINAAGWRPLGVFPESSQLKEADLRSIVASNLIGVQVNLSGADLRGAILHKADLHWAHLRRAFLSKADLTWADFSEADLSEADLSRAELHEAWLSEADLSRANLSEANLSGAYLSAATLFGANLSRTYLSEANLSGAYLNKANVSEANLYAADLREANLSESRFLTEGQVRSAIIDAQTRLPDELAALRLPEAE